MRGTGRGEGMRALGGALGGARAVGGAPDMAVEQWEGLQIEQWNSGRAGLSEQWNSGRGSRYSSGTVGGVHIRTMGGAPDSGRGFKWKGLWVGFK